MNSRYAIYDLQFKPLNAEEAVDLKGAATITETELEESVENAEEALVQMDFEAAEADPVDDEEEVGVKEEKRKVEEEEISDSTIQSLCCNDHQ